MLFSVFPEVKSIRRLAVDRHYTQDVNQSSATSPGRAGRLSVAICTYNRCDSLALTLESLVSQSYASKHNYELLIVDNNCSDDTARIVHSYSERLPIRHVVESKQGLSHARNRAVEEFTGDALLFTDDDVTLERHWLFEYAVAIGRYPEADIFGGRSLAAFESRRPAWLVDSNLALLSGVLVNFDYGKCTRPFAKCEPGPVGASFAVRRRLLDEIGGFRADLGRVGMVPGRGEETEFFDRSVRRGAQRIYVGSALCWHRVDPERLTLRALYRHGLEKGRAHAVMGDVKAKPMTKAFSFLVRGLGQLAKGRGDRARQCVINAGMVVGHWREGRHRSCTFHEPSVKE